MLLTTAILTVAFIICLLIFLVTKNAVIQTLTITVGVTAYHFVMRLAVGVVVNLIMKNKANHNNFWFREKVFEGKLFKIIGIKKWKKYIPSYSPDSFDVNKKTVEEIIGATCQAEIVHEIIMVFSLLPIILIPYFGAALAFIITSVLSALIDFAFVMLQRYNRPRLVKVISGNINRKIYTAVISKNND
jgi:hypothetical protein